MAVWASLGKEAREGEIRHSPEGSAAGEAPSCSHVWGGGSRLDYLGIPPT